MITCWLVLEKLSWLHTMVSELCNYVHTMVRGFCNYMVERRGRWNRLIILVVTYLSSCMYFSSWLLMDFVFGGGIFIVQEEKECLVEGSLCCTRFEQAIPLNFFVFMLCALSSWFCLEVWSVNGGMWSLGWKVRMEKKKWFFDRELEFRLKTDRK